MKWTYRKVLNKGYTPCWYHTDRGIVVAWIEKTGRKYIYVRFNHDGKLRRRPISEQKYFTPFKSKRG
jgi:hypothetical protein